MLHRALNYVQNAGGNATVDNFIEDHEPIGSTLFKKLYYERYIFFTSDDFVHLTKKGCDYLEENK